MVLSGQLGCHVASWVTEGLHSGWQQQQWLQTARTTVAREIGELKFGRLQGWLGQ